MKKILVSLLAITLLAGCSTKPQEEIPTPTPESQNNTAMNVLVCGVDAEDHAITTTYKLDKGAITTVEISYSYPLQEDSDKNEIIKKLNNELFENQDGVTFDIFENETDIVGQLTVDLTQASDEIITYLGLTDDMKTDGQYDVEKVKAFMIDNEAACQIL